MCFSEDTGNRSNKLFEQFSFFRYHHRSLESHKSSERSNFISAFIELFLHRILNDFFEDGFVPSSVVF